MIAGCYVYTPAGSSLNKQKLIRPSAQIVPLMRAHIHQKRYLPLTVQLPETLNQTSKYHPVTQSSSPLPQQYTSLAFGSNIPNFFVMDVSTVHE